jgi:tetratricopeptide (TPR) repeat protein
MTPEHDEILDRNVENLLARAETPPRLSDEGRARVLARLQARPLAAPSPRSTVWPGILALAALLALVWAGMRWGGLTDPGATEHRNPGVAPVEVTLADGSRALLRGGAVVRERAPRAVELVEGEVVFDVEPGAAPFVVHTPHGRAVALGTRFSLRTQPERILAAVVRGTVRIESGTSSTRLGAGEQGVLPADGAPARVDGERLSHVLAWARGHARDRDERATPVRRGNLVARDPRWSGEWPLPVRELVVDIHVENGVARTTIDQTFYNPVPRQLEGVYGFPLPADAAISRLAMYVDGKLMEGGIVERQRGRDVYESIVYQRRDPALLEWMKGNDFRVRIFPLPPRQEKRVILSYTQALTAAYGSYRLAVPIPEIDLPVGRVEYRVHVADAGYEIESDSHALVPRSEGTAVWTGEDVEIGEDLLVTVRGHDAAPTTSATHRDEEGEYLLVRAHPDFTASIGHTPRSWVVLYDTSASRDPQELEAQARLARSFVSEMDEDDRVAFVAFDTQARTMPGGFARAQDLDSAALDAFLTAEARGAGGVTDLRIGLDAAVGLLAGETRAPHVLYLGDGSPSEGPEDAAALAPRIAGRATFVGVALGDGVDHRVLEGLAAATDGMAVELWPAEDLAWRAFEVVAALNSPRITRLQATLLDDGGQALDVDAQRSTEILPHGECVVVVARGAGLASGRAAALRLEGHLGGQEWSETLPLSEATPQASYLPRLWAQARIDAWLRDGGEEHREEITRMGKRHFLITPFTSLLVLESEEMYREFDVARPTGAEWAHYPAPERIEIATEPASADPFGDDPPADELLLRDPLLVLGRPTLVGTLEGEASGAIGLGMLGLVGSGRGGGGLGRGPAGLVAGAEARGPAAFFADDLDRKLEAPAEEDAVRSTSSLAGEDLRFERGSVGRTKWHREANKAAGSGSPRRRFDVANAGILGWSMHGGYRGGVVGQPGVPYPNALHWASDARLDDLTNFVPGMTADGYDRARERFLAAMPDRSTPSVDPGARALVDRARAAIPTGRFALPDGEQLTVDAQGRFTLDRVTAEQLTERVTYDGESLYASYPELSLAVRRRIGPTSPLLLATWAPWVVAPAEDLARWYDLELADADTIRLRRRGGDDQDVLELDLDLEGRVVALRRGGESTTFEHGPDGIEMVAGETRTQLRRIGEAEAIASFDEAAWTVVGLPLRRAEHWVARAAAHASGSPAWRHAQRQRLAAAAALHDAGATAAALRDLAAGVDVLERGELVLASGAASQLRPEELADLRARAPSAGPILAWMAASRTPNAAGADLDRLAGSAGQGLVAALAAYRALLVQIDRGRVAARVPAIERFVAAHPRSELSWVIVQRAGQTLGWSRPAATAALWDLLAREPAFRVAALWSAGQALGWRGKWAEAADRHERALEAALERREPAIVDWQVRQAFQLGRGEASFRLLWNRWRAETSRAKAIAPRVAFVAAAIQLGELDDIRRMVTTLDAATLAQAAATADAVALIDQLLAASMPGEAWHVVRHLLAGAAANEPAVLARASSVSELQGRVLDAATYLERAMRIEAASGGGVALDDLRADYRHLLGLHARLAQSELGSAAAAAHRDRALEVADRWRREDPDHPEIDRLCADLYPDDPARAWRHLSSIVERRPAEGDAWATVADELERDGQLEHADRLWRRAQAVEPTNPTHALRRAQNLVALGDEASAVPLLEGIESGTWQDRFAGVEWQARELRRQLRR